MVTNATATDLQRLLDLQAEDSAIKRLDEQRSALPEAQRVAEVKEQLDELTSDVALAESRSKTIHLDYDRFEGEIEIIDAKIAKEEQRLFSGAVSNPKELGALQAEVEMLKRKKGDLEDQLLEVMEQREQALSTHERLRSEQAEMSSESDRLSKEVEMITHDIEAQLASHNAKRTEIATEIPDDILNLYDEIRAAKGGIGAAALEAGTCQGCHTQLANKEVERLKSEGGLQRCDNCRRILVVG
ncbi:MAG: C4-type zinc ribbon domain-containing protein [Actinomycetota bacterium]|nr:C4-type zinc ribbon domain-containing protein [Actinomycetota bacterium]